MGRKGFTLIELLIVIIIIGVLAAVGIPVLRGYIDEARYAEADAALGAILTAQRVYHAKHNTYASKDFQLRQDGGFDANDASSRYFEVSKYRLVKVTNNAFIAKIPGIIGGDMDNHFATIDQDGDITHN